MSHPAVENRRSGEGRPPACSLVIRCFNEEAHIGKLLAGVMMQTVKDVEIVVVDSGSTDATLAIASRYPVKIVDIRPEDFSFGRALNIGCAASSSEIIVIASAHVYPVYRRWLSRMIEPFSDPAVGLVYGKQRGDENARYAERKIYEKWYPDESVADQKHPFCNNANSAIRRSLWEGHPFDEEMTGLEDLDWARRVQAIGKKIVYAAEAEIVHVHNESAAKIYNRYKREAIAFKRIFPHERFDFRDFLRLFGGNVLSDYFHASRDGVLTANLLDIPLFRFLQFWGTYRGFGQTGFVSQSLRSRFYYPNGLTREKESIAARENGRQDRQEAIRYEHH